MARDNIAEFDEIFPVAPAAFDNAEQLTGFDSRLIEGIDHQSRGFHHNLIVDFAAKEQVSSGGIDVKTGLKPLAFQYGFTATRDRCDDVARTHSFFGGVSGHKFRLNSWLHFFDEGLAALWPLVHDECALQIAYGVYGKKLALRLP